MSAVESLEDHLTAETEQEGFVVDSLTKAEWALRKLRRIRLQQDEVDRLALDEQQRIAQWRAAERERLKDSGEFFERMLESYHRSVLADDPKAKTIKLPVGELKLRKASDAVKVDKDAFLAAQPEDSPLVRRTPAPDIAAIKTQIQQGGEIPDGVEFTRGDSVPETFSVVVSP